MDTRLLAAEYDELARSYAQNRGAFDISAVVEDLLGRLPARGDLLDLGCGAGEPVATTFLARGWRVTGVDASAGMLALAATYAPGLIRVHADMRDVRFAPGSFDAVTAVYSLFHVPRQDHPALLARIREWLRPGGVLLFTYAGREYTGRDRFDGTITFMGHALFYSHGTTAELVDEVAAAGLEVVQARPRDIGGETFWWVTARRPGEPSGVRPRR